MGSIALPLLIGTTAVSTGLSIYSSQQAASQQSDLLRMQQNQQRLAANQLSLKRGKQLEATMASANAAAAARGLGTSPTIANINEQSFQNYAQDERIQGVSNMISDAYNNAEINAIHTRANASSFGSLINFGMNIMEDIPLYGSGGLSSSGKAKPWKNPDTGRTI